MRQQKSTILLLLIFIGFSSTFSSAQNIDAKNVQNTIETFFNGMRSGDVTMLQTTISEDCLLNTILMDSTGSKVQGGTMLGFIESLKKKKPSVIYDERILSYDIKIDGPMAVAWTPYKFYINDKFSHCGVNVFTLAKKSDQRWSVISITDTRRKEPCEL